VSRRRRRGGGEAQVKSEEQSRAEQRVLVAGGLSVCPLLPAAAISAPSLHGFSSQSSAEIIFRLLPQRR
jgi:hypothetical protein